PSRRAWWLPPVSLRASDRVRGSCRLLGDRAPAGQLAELGELEGDGALEVVLLQRGLLLRGEEGRAQAGVADVAAGQLVLAGERVERELAGARQLGRQVGAPQLGAGVLVGERERQLERQP